MSVDSLFNCSLDSLKQIDKPVMGWFCTYVPEEIIYAAGFHPFRVTGTGIKTGKSDTHLPNFFCPYAANCLDGALSKEYDFLKGVIFTDSCNAMCKVHDIWKQFIGSHFVHIVDVPKVSREESLKYYIHTIKDMAAELEKAFNVEISTQKLYEAITIYNTSRDLLKKLSDMMIEGTVNVSESEMLKIISSASYMDRKEFNLRLNEFISERIASGEKRNRKRPRILIAGGVLTSIDFINIIEDYGVCIISDELCTGRRYFEGMADMTADPFEALAGRYLKKVPCARMFESAESRIQYLMKTMEKAEIDGLIYFSLKFCISHSYDSIEFKDVLQKKGIPVLFIDSDYTKSGFEQIKTRVEAFLEML